MITQNSTEVVYDLGEEQIEKFPLVDMDGLRNTLWTEDARPCRNWVRKMVRLGRIPVIEVGRRVFFDVAMVRNALNDEAERERLRRAAVAR